MSGPAITVLEIGKDISQEEAFRRLTGYSTFTLFRCDHVTDGVQCREIAFVNLGNPPKHQLCMAHARLPDYKRFRVRERFYHSDNTLERFEFSRNRHDREAGSPATPHGWRR